MNVPLLSCSQFVPDVPECQSIKAALVRPRPRSPLPVCKRCSSPEETLSDSLTLARSHFKGLICISADGLKLDYLQDAAAAACFPKEEADSH